MEWYLWVLIGYFGIGLLFSLFLTIFMFIRHTRDIRLLTVALFIWPYIIYAILKQEVTK